MNTKIIKRSLCWLITLLLVMSAMVIAVPAEAQAATGTIKVRIANASRRYSEAKSFLDKINAYRSQNGKKALVMDAAYLENAMIRASELALYMDLSYSPNGSSGTRYLTNTSHGSHLVGYDVRSLDALLNQFKSNSNADLLNAAYESVGIGDVSVNGYKYICVLMSDKVAVPAASSVLSQSSVSTVQEIETRPEYLKEISSPYSAGYTVTCGKSLAAHVKVINQGYPTASLYLTPYGASVTFSDPKVFELKDDRVYAVTPGTCTVTIKFPGANSSASCTLKAVGKSFSTCTFDAIADQVYTGKAITPKVVIRNSEGVSLVNGTDYDVAYSNNVNPGTANVVITGKNDYAGESKTLHFNIVGGQFSDSFSVSLTSSSDTISIGETVKLTAVAKGGTTPVKYTFSYALYGSSSWTNLAAGTTSASCNFTPREAKTYLVKVAATDNGGVTAQQSIMLNVKDTLKVTAAMSPQTVVTGTTVKISATIAGGIAPVKVGFYILKPSASKWITLQDYSTTTTATFCPMSEGTYQICVKAKDRNENIVKQYLNIKVTKSTLVNRSTVSASAIDLGASVVLKGVASGGVTPYTYAYCYKKSADKVWHTFKDYSTAASYTFKPAAQTTYNLCIKVKDASGKIEKKYIDLVVYPALVNNCTASAASIELGKSVTLKGAASGGKAGYQYSYWYRSANSSSYAKIKDFSTTQSVSFTPKSLGKWYFRMKVKDATGRVVSRDTFVDVISTLTNKSTVNTTSVATGKSITITCSASGGTAPYQYAVYYRKPGTTSYVRVGDYATTTSRTVKLSTKGSYTVMVKVKDAANTVINKEFTVQAT